MLVVTAVILHRNRKKTSLKLSITIEKEIIFFLIGTVSDYRGGLVEGSGSGSSGGGGVWVRIPWKQIFRDIIFFLFLFYSHFYLCGAYN